jgi:hypothetical protein
MILLYDGVVATLYVTGRPIGRKRRKGIAKHAFVGRRSVTDWRAVDTRRSLWHKTVVGRSLSATVDLATTAAALWR